MDYGIQLLVIIGLFLWAGLWCRDHLGWPPVSVALFFVAGVVCGLVVLFNRSNEESLKESRAVGRKETPPQKEEEAP